MYEVFVDLPETFDTVNSDAMWSILGQHFSQSTLLRSDHMPSRTVKQVSP